MIRRARGTTLAALLCAVGLVGVQAAPPPGKAAAKVNGVAISHAELDAMVKRLGPSAVPQPEAQRREVKASMLGLLIEKELLRQFLDRDKTIPAVTPEEVNRRLKEMEQGLKKDGKSVEEFCHDTHQTLEQFKGAIAEHVRWSNYVRRRAKEEVLQTFYQENKEIFDGVTVKASHIVLRLPRGASADEVARATTTLEGVRDKIVHEKADFAEMARRYSQGPTAKNGGDLGAPFPRRSELDEPFAKAAFALKAGEVSKVVPTDYGLHLIKVTKRFPGKPTTFASAREAVLELFAEELRQDVLTEERKKAKIEVFLD
jgi:peptidyl-prolyl cis-trans isomerase C